MGVLEERHDRVCRQTLAANPGLTQAAIKSGKWLPLVRIAWNAELGLSKFYLAKRLGEIARVEYHAPASKPQGER